MGKSKLVRDKIPTLIEQREGRAPRTRILSGAEYDGRVRDKIQEEAEELARAGTKAEIIGEAADLYEIVEALLALHGITKQQVLTEQARKRRERGGFDGRILLVQE